VRNLLIWIRRAVPLIIVGSLVAAPGFAGKPSWAGGGKKHENRQDHGGGDKYEKNRDDRGAGNQRDRDDYSGKRYFDERKHALVQDYFVNEYRAGHCPPGLAKKHNGCMPPGQAKKWHMGRPLPRDVVFYDLPPRLVVELGVPPSGHKFVRVASDILLIAIGTGMVVDAIDDLGRM